MSFQEIIQSKYFISIISFVFGILIYKFYLYIKMLQTKFKYSDKLYDVVENYIKKGKMNISEYLMMVELFKNLSNYMGTYKTHVDRMMKELGETGGLDFVNAQFEEIKEQEPQKPQSTNLEALLKENLELKKRMNNLLVNKDNEIF